MHSKRFWLLFIYLAGLACIYTITQRLLEAPIAPGVFVDDLTEVQKQTLNLIVEVNKLLLSWALLLIGGIAALVFKFYQRLSNFFIAEILLILSLMLALASVYFGVSIFAQLIEVLSVNMFEPVISLVRRLQTGQYYCLLISVALAGGTVFIFGYKE